MQVFFSPAKREGSEYIIGAIDFVHPTTGRGAYSGQSLDDMLAEYGPGVEIIASSEAYKRSEDACLTDPTPIDAERFQEMLEVLPPCRWHHSNGIEWFHVSERLTGNVVSWFAHSHGKYWEMQDRATLTLDELAAKLNRARA